MLNISVKQINNTQMINILAKGHKGLFTLFVK